MQQQTDQTTTSNYRKDRHYTFIGSKLAKTTANFYQQNFIGQQNLPVRNNNDTHKIQDIIRNKPHH